MSCNFMIKALLRALVLAALLLPGGNAAANPDDLIKPSANFVLTEKETRFIKSLGPLKVMVDDNFVPLSTFDEKKSTYDGISVALFRHIAEQLGLNYQIERDSKLPWSAKESLLKSGKIDILMPVSYTNERATAGMFSTSFYETFYGVIAIKAGNIRVNNTSELGRYRIGATKSSAILSYIKDFLPTARLVIYDNQNAMYQGVRNGEVDVALQNKNVFREDRFNMGFVDLALIHTITESPRKYSFYFKKSDPHHQLVEIFNRYLAGVDYNRLISYYERGEEELIVRYTEQKNRQKLLTNGLVGLVALLIVLGVTFLNHRRLTTKLSFSLEQIQAQQEELQKNEKQLSMVLRGSQLGYWDWNITTGEVKRNARWAEMLGYTLDEIEFTVTCWDTLIHDDDRQAAWQSINDHLEGITPMHSADYRMLCKNKQWKWISDRATIVEYGTDGKPLRMSGTHQDITEQKQMEERLQQSLKMESIGRLAGGVAHDFNNKLCVILGYSEMLQMDFADNKYVLDKLNAIATAAEHSKDITSQLLTFSRQQLAFPKEIQPNEAIKATARTLPRLIGEDITLSLELAENLWRIKIDPTQLDQIIMNLATNARDAMPQGGKLTITTSNVSIVSSYCWQNPDAKPGDYVKLTVTDSGHGINPENSKHIFEPFFTTKDVGKGTGLGLATVYGIVIQNSGFITIDSNPGDGTKFMVHLPRFDGEEVAVETGSTSKQITGAGKILLVEDDNSVNNMTAMMLKKIGYTVISAGSPQDAIVICGDQNLPIDLVISDVVMPVMDGKTMMDKIRERRPNIKALFMSGYSADHISVKGIVDGKVYFIQKPFSMAELNNKVMETQEL